MADSTDIDKLRELAEADDCAEFGSETVLALVAELVGLRTEVDQLRNTFIGDPKCSGCAGGGLVWSGAEYAGTREYVGCPDCEGTGVAPPGLYGTVRSLLSNLWDVRAERDALQVRIDATIEQVTKAIGITDHVRTALLSTLRGTPFRDVAALGVDPQKETQQ